MRMPDAENLSCGCAVVCENAESAAVLCSLGDFLEGTRLRIRELRGCGRVTSRLYSMGFTPGTIITVCGSGANGACRVQVRDTCVALDPGVAENIVCVPVSQGG